MIHKGICSDWTLLRWGPEDLPDLIGAMFKWPEDTDVVLIRGPLEATAYRVPGISIGRIWNPPKIWWQCTGNFMQTLKQVLALPHPGAAGAPALLRNPWSACRVPPGLPQPMVLRPR